MRLAGIVHRDPSAIVEQPRCVECIYKDVLEQVRPVYIDEVISLVIFEKSGKYKLRKFRSVIEEIGKPGSHDGVDTGLIIGRISPKTKLLRSSWMDLGAICPHLLRKPLAAW